MFYFLSSLPLELQVAGAAVVVLIVAFLCLLVYAHLPFRVLEILNQTPVPDYIKEAARKQFWAASFNAIITIPIDLMSPIVVPFILIFTKWEAEKLAFFDSIWGNDASINGDQRGDNNDLIPISLDKNDEHAISLCYWAKGHHPRSFYARWVWLGLRNRASALTERMGIDVVRGTGPDANYQFWVSAPEDFDGWNLKMNPARTTWVIRSVNGLDGKPVVSIFAYETSFFGKYRRMYFGAKIPLTIPEWSKSMVASVGWSLR